MTATKETKKAQKARLTAERKAAKDEAKKAEHRAIFGTHIAKAVAPLKIQAIANAEIKANEWVNKKIEELAAVGMDINKIAPAPAPNIGREAYRAAAARRASFEFITKYKKNEMSDRSWRDMTVPRVVVIHPEGIDRYIESCKESAAMQYEGFVYKMVRKVGEHVAAVLADNNVWGYSHLHVTMPDGTVQKWRTQTIINVSVYGKLFNQWPSRIVK